MLKGAALGLQIARQQLADGSKTLERTLG